MRFGTVAAIGLKSTLGHGYPLLFLKGNLRLSCRFEYTVALAQNPVCASAHDAALRARIFAYSEKRVAATMSMTQLKCCSALLPQIEIHEVSPIFVQLFVSSENLCE